MQSIPVPCNSVRKVDKQIALPCNVVYKLITCTTLCLITLALMHQTVTIYMLTITVISSCSSCERWRRAQRSVTASTEVASLYAASFRLVQSLHSRHDISLSALLSLHSVVYELKLGKCLPVRRSGFVGCFTGRPRYCAASCNWFFEISWHVFFRPVLTVPTVSVLH